MPLPILGKQKIQEANKQKKHSENKSPGSKLAKQMHAGS